MSTLQSLLPLHWYPADAEEDAAVHRQSLTYLLPDAAFEETLAALAAYGSVVSAWGATGKCQSLGRFLDFVALQVLER